MAAPLPPQALRRRRAIFWTLAAGYVLVYFHRLSPAVLAVDMMRDLKVGGGLGGLLGAAYFYPYALMQLPAGLLADSWGPRRSVASFFLVAAAGCGLLAAAPDAASAILGRVLVGLGVAMLFVATMKVLSQWFRPDEFAPMTGILMAMGGLGSLSATAPLAFLSGWMGWRLATLAVGALTLLLAGLVWVFVRDRPSDLGLPAVAPPPPPGPRISLGEGVRLVLRRPAFWALATWYFFEYAAFFAFTGLWGGPYLMQVHGLAKPDAGKVLSMAAYGTVIGSLVLSQASNRLFRARKPVIVLASGAAVVATAVLAFRTAAVTVPALYFVCLSLGFFTGAVVTVAFAATKELFPLEIAGTSTGLVNLFPFAGAAVAQPLLGVVLERHRLGAAVFSAEGYREAFLLLFGCALCALAASLLIRETLPRTRATP